MYSTEHEVLGSVLSAERDEVILWMIEIPCLAVAEHWKGRSAAPSCGKIRSISIHLRLFLYHRHTHTHTLAFYKEDLRAKPEAELTTAKVPSVKDIL